MTTSNPTISIEVGKTYTRRDGKASGIITKPEPAFTPGYPFYDAEACLSYNAAGQYNENFEDPADLVGEAS
jgi:hypothetical protein